MNNIIEVLREALLNNQSRFASFTYTNQKGETSQYLLHLCVDARKVVQRDLKVVASFSPSCQIEESAHAEVLSSLQETLDTNFNNSQYTKPGYYTYIHKGVKVHENTIYINAFVVSKKVLVKGEYKPVKSSEKTIAKNRIRKMMKYSQFREFRLDISQMKSVRMNGKVIEIN